MERHTYRLDDGFSFESGGSVSTLEVAYHTSPVEYEKGMKVIWICHALTSDSNAEDWWSALVGPGKLFDTEKYFVVCCNMVGSCYGSSGPSSIDPETGKPYYFAFPKVPCAMSPGHSTWSEYISALTRSICLWAPAWADFRHWSGRFCVRRCSLVRSILPQALA